MTSGTTALECPSCGRRFDEPTRFCPSCGARIDRLQEAAEDTVAQAWNREHPTDLMATATRTVGPPASPRTDPAAAETRASRSDRSMLLGLAVAAALIVVILVVALFVGGVFDSGHGSTPSATSSPSASTPGSAPPTTTTATSSTIPTPTSTTTPIAPSTTPSSPPARPPQDQPTSSYSGQTFSIQYPVGWTIKNAESQESWGTDTTIVSASDPNVLLRVDVSPNTPVSDPLSLRNR